MSSNAKWYLGGCFTGFGTCLAAIILLLYLVGVFPDPTPWPM